MRTFSFGMYRAFVYFDDKKSAKTFEHTVKSVVDKNSYEIYVKRGCTEYENKLPSSKWQVGNDQPAFEKFLEDTVQQSDTNIEREYAAFIKEHSFVQPNWLKHTIRLYWAQSAYASGDHTWANTPYAPYVQTSKTPVKY